jgi:WD40 repeat protein
MADKQKRKLIMIRLLLTLVMVALFTGASQAQDTGTYVEIERIGRGVIDEIFWSHDGATLAVTTSRGIWFYHTDDLKVPPRWIERNETPLVAFDPAWETMAIAEEGGISLYHVATGERFRQLKAGYTVYRTLTFSSDGRRLAGAVDTKFAPAQLELSYQGESFIHVWTILSEEIYEMSEGARTLQVYYNTELLPDRALSFSPDGTKLAIAGYFEGGDYGLWQFSLLDLDSDKVLTTSNIQDQLSNDFTLENARLLVAPYSERNLVLFDPQPEQYSIEFLLRDTDYDILDISPDARRVVVREQGDVLLKDILTGDVIAPLPMGYSSNSKISPEGRRIAIVSEGRLGIYEVNSLSGGGQACGISPTACWTYTDAHSAPRFDDLEPAVNTTQRPLNRAETVSPDGKWLIGSYSQEQLNGVYLIRLADEKEFLLETDEKYPIVVETRFSPDSSLAAGAFTSRVHGGSYNHVVRVWSLGDDTPDLQPIAKLEHPDAVRRLVFSPDGRRLATTSLNNVYIWDTATWGLIATLPHPRPVYSLTFSADSTILTTAANDGVIRLWRG